MNNLNNALTGWFGFCVITAIISILQGGLPSLFSYNTFWVFFLITLAAILWLFLPFLGFVLGWPIQKIFWVLGKISRAHSAFTRWLWRR